MSNVRTILECPKCAAMVAFEYASSNIRECTCGSVIQRTNMAKGETQELQVADTLHTATVRGYYIKPGTTGEWEKKTFKVLGKMGVWFEESFYSYWFIVFNDGETGFLAEGYGMYSILVPEKTGIIKSGDLAHNKIGQVATISNYQLQKKNRTYYWEVESELHLENVSAHFEVFEYASAAGKLLTIFEWAGHEINAYFNNPVSFEALNLKNTQEKNPYGKELKCPLCFKPIKITTYPLAQSCVCGSCGTFYAIENHQPDKKGNNGNNLFDPLLPLGLKGILKDVEYEVVGYTKKEEQASKSKWREYVLFNPKYGFAFLSEYDGHWIFLKETISSPVVLNDNTKEFGFSKKTFNLFNSYTYKVDQAKGEFPYNIFDNKNTLVKEYISPPEIWIREKDNREGITWFHGQHISSKEITTAFTVNGAIPSRVGTGAVQPSAHMGIEKLLSTTLLAVVVLLIIHLLFIFNKQDKVIVEETYHITDDSTDKATVVIEKFDLTKWRSNLCFEISAPVSNSWFELGATLVNTVTGEEYNIQKGVEYYSGYTDGESWTEGSTSATAYMTNIPAGTYFLQMEGTREHILYQRINNFSVKVVYDGTEYRNFWFAVLLLVAWQVINYLISNQKEKNRWANSPFSNYNRD